MPFKIVQLRAVQIGWTCFGFRFFFFFFFFFFLSSPSQSPSPSHLISVLRRLNISPARTAVTLGTGFIGNHWDDTLRVASGTFSIKNLRGSFLDHSGKGDTGILFGGEFHQDRFNFLLSHSTDGRSLSINDLADAVRDNLRRDRVPLSPRSISEDVFEAAALINTFGTTDARGQLSISFETLLNLYKYRTLPQARLLFQRPATGVIGHVDTMRKMLTRMGLRDIRIAAAPTPNAASDVSRDSAFTAATPVFCPNSVPRSYTDSGCKINGAAFSCSPAGPFALMSRDVRADSMLASFSPPLHIILISSFSSSFCRILQLCNNEHSGLRQVAVVLDAAFQTTVFFALRL